MYDNENILFAVTEADWRSSAWNSKNVKGTRKGGKVVEEKTMGGKCRERLDEGSGIVEINRNVERTTLGI